MKNILSDLEKWLDIGHAVALATVVNAQGSTPRDVGTMMAVNDHGAVSGSLSGGCVEAAVIEECLSVLEGGCPRLLTYGVADELGLEIGLTCGGTLSIFVEPWELTPIREGFLSRLRDQRPFVLGTVVKGAYGAKFLLDASGETLDTLEDEELLEQVKSSAITLLSQRKSALISLSTPTEVEVKIFLQSFTVPPHLMIFGAVDFGWALCQLAKLLGFRVTICDPREALATGERFPEADQILVDSPSQLLKNTPVDTQTAIAVLTHDPKFDIPLLVQAVQTNAGYIGAMGSRQTTANRREKLKAAGLTEAEIGRIHAPIGLDIGAITPEETAVSIMGEIIATVNGRAGGSLSLTQVPIHSREVLPVCQ